MRKDARIQHIVAREILDSRGVPTVEVEVRTGQGCGMASVPSGASVGKYEAVELRDQDPKRYLGKGVRKALRHICQEIAPLLKGCVVTQQEVIDQRLIEAEGTENKSRWGANALLGVSLAVARAAAVAKKKPLYASMGDADDSVGFCLPRPMMNILNGGVHASNPLDIQEFMIVPLSTLTFAETLRLGAEIFHVLKRLLTARGYPTNIGDEGGFASPIRTHEEAIDLILMSIEEAGYVPGLDVGLALDAAGSAFYDEKSHTYRFVSSGRSFSSAELVSYWQKWVAQYPIFSLEDAMGEDDWSGWEALTKVLGSQTQLVGDDLFVTNKKRLREGVDRGVANAVLVKPNQIGTLTETLQLVRMAKQEGYRVIISHRSGETEDTFVSDLAVATGSGQIKTGSVCRSERTAKYNRLLRISQEIKKDLLPFPFSPQDSARHVSSS